MRVPFSFKQQQQHLYCVKTCSRFDLQMLHCWPQCNLFLYKRKESYGVATKKSSIISIIIFWKWMQRKICTQEYIFLQLGNMLCSMGDGGSHVRFFFMLGKFPLIRHASEDFSNQRIIIRGLRSPQMTLNQPFRYPQGGGVGELISGYQKIGTV